LSGIAIDAAHLSYVGDAGWELTCPAAEAHKPYRGFITSGANPAGLFAQTSMRIEKRFPAFGQGLDTDLDPLQVGPDFALALVKTGTASSLDGISVDVDIARSQNAGPSW